MTDHIDKTELEFEIVFLKPDQLPPLDQPAETLLQALREAPHPLSHRQLQKQTSLSSPLISNSIALLMMHQMVKSDRCRKRGQVWRLVGHEYPVVSPGLPKSPQPRKPKPLQGQDELF